MLNFPVEQRVELLNELFDRLNPGRPIVQISYGPVSPIPPDWQTYSVEPFDWMVRNIPPARLWVFRRILAA
jgi:phosphatidylethanolamine/phosphatidyl-N-methylethanolamine N-methyltransferase